MCRATASPRTQKGAEPSAVTNSLPCPASAITRAIATRAPPARLTAVGCRRSIERIAATRARIKRVIPFTSQSTRHTAPYTGMEHSPVGTPPSSFARNPALRVRKAAS
jgi:hypothetical protein